MPPGTRVCFDTVGIPVVETMVFRNAYPDQLQSELAMREPDPKLRKLASEMPAEVTDTEGVVWRQVEQRGARLYWERDGG